MEVSVSKQAFTFLAMVLCGAVCGLVFDVFRSVRRSFKTASGVVAIQDILFWLAELALVYMAAFRLNYASVRAYEGIALVIGSWIYFMTVSERVIKIFCLVITGIKKTAHKAFSPVRKAATVLYGFFKKELECIKIKILRLKQMR